MANDIIVQIKLDDGTFKQGIVSAEQLSKASGKKIGENLADGTEQGFKSSFSGVRSQLLGLAAGILTVSGIKSFLSKAIEEASGAETALIKLNIALSNAGTFSQKASQDFQDFAKSIQATTAFGDDQVLGLSALARNFARTNEEAIKLTKAALDLSVATGVDAETAVKQLGGTLSGNIGLLGKSVGAVKGLTEEQLKLGGALDLVAAKFSGSAQASVNTFAGRTAQLQNNFNDVFEEIGKIITQSPTLLRIIEGISIAFKNVADSISGFKGDPFKGLVNGLITFGQAVVTYVISPLELVTNIGQFVFANVKLAIQSVVTTLAQFPQAIFGLFVFPLIDAADKAGQVIGFFNKDLGAQVSQGAQSVADSIRQPLKALADGSNEVLDQFAADAVKARENILNFDTSAQISLKLTEFQMFLNGASEAQSQFVAKLNETAVAASTSAITVGQAFSSTFAGFKAEYEKIAASSDVAFKKIGASMMQNIGQAGANAFASFGKAIAKGENGIQAFLDSLLSAMGQMAIQLGGMFILQGLAYLFAGLPNGGSLIAAGAALAAIGGILSASGGGANAPQGQQGGGIAGGGAVVPIGAGVATEQPDQENQRPGTAVTVNVSGNILDRRETGLELARIINESFDSNGTTIAAGAIS